LTLYLSLIQNLLLKNSINFSKPTAVIAENVESSGTFISDLA